jgi:tRNA1(Val) A37 N6-methylase TrmN6
MRRHDTPPEVAEALLRWLPADARSLLDPAVGRGALIAPLLCHDRALSCDITCVDTDPAIITDLNAKFKHQFPRKFRPVSGDFLQLDFDREGLLPHASGFDCIIMNPPWDGRRWVDGTQADPAWSRSGYRGRNVSIEAAFILKAITLLRPGGTLLAILPPSVISGSAARPVREHLLESGRIRRVHELSPFTFRGIEARIYLLVFEKSQTAESVTLLNHRLINPDILKVSQLEPSLRLDYGYYASEHRFAEFRAANAWGWTPLSEQVVITRGIVSVPKGTSHAVHISDYEDGFWHSQRLEQISPCGIVAGPDDILMARVGRTAFTAVGLLDGPPAAITDCVFRLQPHEPRDSARLLFALRCMNALRIHIPLLQRNSGGAHYVSSGDLATSLLPTRMADAFPNEFSRYLDAVDRRDFAEMDRCESSVRESAFS